jgi:hypothetical protein
MIITERETDMAGKYRVLVEIDNTKAIPLKYATEVDDSVVLADAQGVLDREAEQAELDVLNPINFEL